MKRRWLILLTVLASALTSPHAGAQQSWRIGSVESNGRVSYSLTYVAAPAAMAISVRRAVDDGRWNSLALDLARDVWSWSGRRLSVRTVARQELLRAPHPTVAGVDLRWRAADRLTLSGGARLKVHPQKPSRQGLKLVLGVVWGR